MSKLDVKLVEKMYSDYGQELTPERLDYITNQFSNNNDFSNSFLKKYDPEKAVSSTEVEKKNPVSTITSEETPSESPIQEPKKNTLSVGGNPVQTGASASSVGKGKSIFGESVSTFQEGLISDKTAKDKDKEKPKKKVVSIKKKEEELPFLKDIDRSSLKMELDGSIKKDSSGNVISIPKSKDAQEIVGDIQKRNADIQLIKQTGINEDIKKKQEQGIAPPTSELIKAGAVDLELSTGDGGVSEFLRAKSFEEKIAQQSKTPIEKAKESNKSLKINYDNFIKSRDLDLENPYAYYSKIKDGNLEIKELYGDNPIVNEIDFDGFLRKNGYLYDFKEELKSGFYTKDGAASNSEYNEELLKEKKLVDYFKLYLEDRVQRDFDKNSALYLKKNPNATIEEIEKNVEKKSIDQKLFDSYIYSNFPAYNKATSERKEKEAKEYKEYKENKGEFFSWQTGRNILKGIDNTLFKRVNEVSSTVYDLIGFEGISKKLRYKAEEVAFLNPQDRNISYVSGKKVSFGGNEYLVDSQGNIYDYEIKKRVTDLFDKDAYKSLIDQSKKGEDDYMFSWSGSTIQTTNVVADLGLQVLVTRGFSGASSLMGRGLTKEGLSMLKNIPLSKEMAASGAAQTFLGYSDGLESTLVAAKNYGIPDNEAKELANDAAMKMAGVYLLTSGISPQTKAAFSSTKNKVISEAMEAYAKNGRKGYLLAMDKGMSKLMEFGKEGTKETVQETIQQGAATYGVNKSINKKAGKKILQEEMTGDQIISMIPSTFVAGGIPVMLRMGTNIFSRKDYLSNLDTASNNVDLSNKRLGELLQSNAITQDEYNKSKEDLRVYSQNKNKIPKDTSAEIVLDVARGLDEISKLESQKQSLDKAFHPDIDKKIEAKRNEVKQLYSDQKTQEENEQTKLKIEAASILKKEALDSGIKEEDINISSDLINKKAKELYNQKTQQTNEEVTGQTNAEEKPTGINAEQTISATQQKDGMQLQPQEKVANKKPAGLEPNGGVDSNVDKFETYSGNKFEITLTNVDENGNALPRGEGNKKIVIKTIESDGTVRVNNALTKTFKTAAEAKEYANKFIEKDSKPTSTSESIIEDQEKVNILRTEEIKELTENVENPDSFITDGKVDANKIAESDNAKAKEIYAKYDKLLKPLLNNIKIQQDAIQKQSTDEGLLQPEQSKMGLQEVEQGNAKQEVVAEQSKEKINNYVSKLESTKASDPDTYWSVSPVTVDDASKSAIIDTEDGAAAVKPDGDIVGVFKKPESKAKGVAQELLKKAVEAGGIKLDNFDGYLTKQYEKAGFRVVSKTPFNEEFAPEGWNKDKHGTPDVVAMVYDPKGELNIEEKTFKDKDTGYDDMIAYRDKLISDQATKFQKSKIEIDGSTVDLITEEMNSMPEEIAKFDIPSNLTTKEKTNIGSLTDRFNDKVKTIKDISELDGVPFIFTISDQLTSGKITNPFTGSTIDVKGGIGFNMTEGNEGNAWANTTEAEANNMLQRATDVYSKNKDLFDRLWSEGKVPNGHVPMAVVKMGQTSIKSNEALFRFASDTFKKRFSKAKRIAAKNGLLKDLKSAKDIDQDVIDFVAKQNTIDEVLDNIKELSISKRPDITGFVFTGGIKLGAKTRPGKPKSNVGRSLVGDNKNDYKYVHLQTINNLISEPATASIPDSHIVSVVGVDVLNPSVTKVDHQNYPFGVKGQLIGVLENPVHAADVFPEMYSKSIYLQKENKAGVPTSPETAVRQSVAAGGAVANIKAFRGAKIATKMTDLQKLLGKLKLAFPSVTIVDTQEEFLKELDNPNVKRFVKDGDVVYGFTKNGKVFLNPEKANSNTAIHEYSHIWTGFLKENNPGLLKKGYDLLEGSSILNDKISEFGDNELARDEAMAELIANKGETIIEASIKSKFKNWLNAVFNYVKANFKSFDKMSATELQNLNLNQFVDGALSSLLGGKEVTSKEIKVIGVKFSKETNKQELSDTKKEIQEVFSAAKEALKIEKDKNKVINDLKNKVNAFVKVAIQDLKAGDIGNRAITSIASRVQSVKDQNFDEKLLEVNSILDNLYTNRDVNKAKADKKKALKNVMAGKVGKLDKRGDRAKVMASKIVNFALLNPTILKKVLDDADFGLYTDYISNLAERKDALSDTDLKSYDRLYDEIVAPYKKYTDKVNEIQGKIDTNIPLSDSEQAFVDKNKSDFYEKEDVAAEEEKDAEKKAKKEAEIAKKKDAIKGLLPMMPKVFEDSDAEKGSFEWKILSALTSLDESDVDAMPESILSNVTNALNSMINDDVVPTYAEDLYRYTVKNKAKNLFLETVAKAGKGGLYKTKAGRAALKVREILGNPFTTIRGLAKGDLDAELLDKRIKMFRFSAIDSALKIYGETPIFDGIASVLGKGMSNLASTEAKAEEGLLNAKKLIDKKSKNAQESYMKITYHLIDAMAKNNQGTKSDVSAIEYFESTVSDPNSKVRENKAALKVVQDFIAKVKANGGSVELTPEEATAANAIRIVLDENQVTAYEANLFQNANASPMIAEYFPVSNSVKSQTDNDLANMQSRFGINGVVSTKSGNLEEKTGKAHPIDMNPFTAAFSSIKNTAVQFNLRSEYLGISQGLQESINDAIKNGDQDSELFLNGIQKALNSEFDLIVNGSVFGSNDLMDNVFNAIDRTFYQVMLGSVISRSVDYTGNIIQLAALNPKLLVSGNKIIKDLKVELKSGESEFELLREFYKNAEASDINKMMSAKSATTERTEFLNKGINKGVLSKGLPFSNIFTKVKARFVAPIDEKLSGINEGLISISDVKPYGISWNSIFRDTFLAETGSDVDVAKVARGDKKYLKDNADAIKIASNKANRESADLFGSTNPFEKQVGIMEVTAGKKNSKNPLSALVNRAKYFLSGFNIGANTSMTTAINTFVENKDPREARKALGGAIRVGMYRTAVAAVSGMIWSLFKGDDDDEDKLVKSFDKLADDDKFIKEMNNLFLDFPIRKDRDGNPVNLSMKDFEQYNKLRDKLLSNKDFKNAYDIYYKFINRNLFDEAVRLRANQINTSKEKVFKQNIEMFFDEIKGGFPKDDTQIIETLAILHSNEGAKLFTSEEVDGYILDIENHMSKIGFLDNRALRNANSQIDRMIINETALLLSDHRNQSAEDIIVKEGAQLLMGLMFPRSNNIIKGGYNYLAESANKMMIQSRRGERGYDLYKDMIFQPIVKTGLSDKSQGVVKEAIGVLNPALKDLLKKDNEDAATVSMLRYIKTIGTLGLNDFNKINSKMKNDEIYQKTNGKFKENIIKDIAKDKVDIIREVTDKEGIESDAKERGVYKSRVLPGIDSTEVKSKLPSYMDKKDLKINGRSIE